MKTKVDTANAPAALGPYSQAIIANYTLYASGQIGLNPATGELVEGGVEAQTRQVLANIQAVLDEAKSTPAQVVKTTIFLADMNDFVAVNAIYGEFFPMPYPARSTVQVAKLPKGALVEIEIIAVLN